MKRELLEKLGLEKEAIDKIMDENGIDIEAEKAKVAAAEADRDKYKEQLEESTKALEAFKGIKPEELTAEIEKLQQTIKDKETEHAAKIADMQFDSSLDKAIAESGAKNAKAVKALLDVESLKNSKNQKDDIKSALEAVKKDNDYMFGSDEPINNSISSTRGGGGADQKTAALMAAAGLPPEDNEK